MLAGLWALTLSTAVELRGKNALSRVPRNGWPRDRPRAGGTGANVAVHYRPRLPRATRGRRVSALGVDAIAVQADQRDAPQVRRAVARAVRRFGRIDVLVNCAAVYERTPWRR